MRKALIFVTGNIGKAKEAEAILGQSVLVRNLEVPEIQSLDVREVVREKAKQAFFRLRRPLIVDDVGIYINAWNGFPGPFMKYLVDAIGVEGIARLLQHEKNRSVIVRIAVGFHDGKRLHTFLVEERGQLAQSPRGKYGFGWDPLFIPDGHTKTYAEMTPAEKNNISHRRMVLEKLKRFLEKG